METREKLIDMYTKMVRIRRFDEKVAELNSRGVFPGLTHTYIGEEAIAVGVCANLREDDYVTSTHRGHGHCIAKGASVPRMMAELLGRSNGLCKGKGGSMHVCDYSIGIIGAQGIVASSIPIAAGVGLGIKLSRTDRVVACFFGDAASNQGQFHEGLNIAAIWKLPVIFVCENNQYGISTHVSKSTSVPDVATRGKSYNIPGVAVDGNDVLRVSEAAMEAVKSARAGLGPTLLECKTYRMRGHQEGDPDTYRRDEERQQWKKLDPIERFGKKLAEMSLMTPQLANDVEEKIRREVDEAVAFAKASPYPNPESALEDLYA